MKTLSPVLIRKTLIILLILFAEYAVFGFLILPLLVRHFGERALQQHLSEFAEIEQVRMNPFLFRAEVSGLKIPNAENEPWIAVDGIRVDFAVASVWRFYPVIEELSLKGPFFKSLREPAELEETEAESKEWREQVAAIAESEFPRLEIRRLEVAAGHLEYVDSTTSEEFQLQVQPIDFTVTDFSSADATDDQFAFHATTPSGTSIRMEGDLNVEKRMLVMDFELSDVRLSELAPYYTDLTNFAVKRAIFSTQFRLSIDLLNLDDLLLISDARAELRDVQLERLDDDNRIIGLERMTVEGLESRFPNPEVHMERIRFENGSTQVARDSDGNLNLMTLFKLKSADELASDAEVVAEDSSDDAAGLPWSIQLMEIEGYLIQWHDRYGDLQADSEVMVEYFSLEGVNDDLSVSLPLKARYRVGDKGELFAEGLAALDGSMLELDLKLSEMPLDASGAYLQKAMGAQLNAGTLDMDVSLVGGPEGGYTIDGLLAFNGIEIQSLTETVSVLEFERFELEGHWDVTLPKPLSFKGDLRLNALGLEFDGQQAATYLERFESAVELDYGGSPAVELSASGQLKGLELTQGSSEGEFALDSLVFTKLDVRDSPLQLDLESVDLEGLRGHLIRHGTTQEAEGDDVSVESAPKSDTPPAEWSVGRVGIVDGAFKFEDQSMDQTASVELSDFELKLSGLSSAQGKIANMDLSSLVNKAPLMIEGSFSAAEIKQSTSLKIQLLGLGLPSFSPYSGAAVGRKIDNGTFTLEGDWTIEGSRLKARNQLLIDGFTFGEKVPDPAVSLPLDLALTLLKRPDGSMSLSLPLSGDLSSPDVSVGSIVISAFTGLIMKATTAPFSLLTSMIGSDQDLSKVVFEEGSANLSADTISVLNTLAQALVDRPALKMSLLAHYTDVDVELLKQKVLYRQLTDGKEQMDAKAYQKRLSKAYSKWLKESGESSEPLPMESDEDYQEVEALMAAALPLPVEELAVLCQRREEAVFNFLTEVKEIDPARIAMSQKRPDEAQEEAAVFFELN